MNQQNKKRTPKGVLFSSGHDLEFQHTIGGGNHVFRVDAEKAEPPKTADAGVMRYAGLFLASLTGIARWSKKRT